MLVYKINQFTVISLLLSINLLVLPLKAQQFPEKNFIIENVKVFDGWKFIPKCRVLVEEGKITTVVAEGNLGNKYPVVNGEGKSLMPGLFNAHVHAWIPYHLQNAMQYGVYSLVDLHSLNDLTAQLKELDRQSGHARLYGAGYAATVEGGHGTQFGFPVPVIGRERSCFDFIDQQVAAGVDHIKIIYEPAKATLKLSQVDSLVQRAHHHDKKVIVHISNVQDALDVARLGADGLAHLWRDRAMTPDEMSLFASYGTFVIPTLTVYERVLQYWKLKKISINKLTLDQMQDEVKRLASQGVTLLAGTDPPNFELDYGKSLHRELVLFDQAGLSSAEVLSTATSNIEKVLGYSGASILPGNSADFVLVEGDLENNISNTLNIVNRWVSGKIVSPLE